MSVPVSIVKCPGYEPEALYRAIADAFHAANVPPGASGGSGAAEGAERHFDPRGKRILLKPNILIGSDPAQAIATHPEFLRQAIRLFRELGAAEIMVGESPSHERPEAAAAKAGIMAVVEGEGARWVDFSEGVQVDNPRGELVKNFTLARAAIEADAIVDLPKLKTHQLMYYTGAMKNLFGLVPGVQKAAFHMRFPARESFARMLVDLNLAVRPAFVLMDAILGMEGKGPGAAGTPRQIGLVLASPSAPALDWIASSVVGYDPRLIPYLRMALGTGCWFASPDEIEVRGEDPREVRVHGFRRVPIPSASGEGRGRLGRLVHDLATPRPFFDRGRCIRCGACIRICPGKALGFQPSPGAADGSGGKYGRYVAVDYAACLRCYCCHEVCPASAITLRRF